MPASRLRVRSQFGPQQRRLWMPILLCTGTASASRLAYEFGASLAQSFVFAVPFAVAMVALTQTLAIRRSRDWLEVTAAGIAPTRFRSVLIPGHAVAFLEVRIWPLKTRNADEREACLSARLTDGRIAQIPSLQRTMSKPQRDWRVEFDVDGRGWTPLTGADGTPLNWTLLTDDEVLTALAALVTEVAGGFGDAQTSPLSAGVALEALAHRDPPDRSFDEGYVSKPATKSLPPRWAHKSVNTPDWTPPCAAAFYWSRASARTSRAPMRRPGLRFDKNELRLIRHFGTDAIAYDEIDRFDIVLRENNVWELSLVLRNGSFRDLPGLRHGLWATNPLLLNNELRWSGSDGTDSLPWGSDGTRLVVCRLNAQLAVA